MQEIRLLLPGRALSIQMELSSQGGIDHRHLGASVQQKVVWAGMVDGYRHDHLVAVCEMEGTLGTFPGQCDSVGSVGTMVAARTKEANHLKVDILSAPQPGWLKKTLAHNPTWS